MMKMMMDKIGLYPSLSKRLFSKPIFNAKAMSIEKLLPVCQCYWLRLSRKVPSFSALPHYLPSRQNFILLVPDISSEEHLTDRNISQWGMDATGTVKIP